MTNPSSLTSRSVQEGPDIALDGDSDTFYHSTSVSGNYWQAEFPEVDNLTIQITGQNNTNTVSRFVVVEILDTLGATIFTSSELRIGYSGGEGYTGTTPVITTINWIDPGSSLLNNIQLNTPVQLDNKIYSIIAKSTILTEQMCSFMVNINIGSWLNISKNTEDWQRVSHMNNCADMIISSDNIDNTPVFYKRVGPIISIGWVPGNPENSNSLSYKLIQVG
jgi:hypothetical protein